MVFKLAGTEFEILICLECGESVRNCQCAESSPSINENPEYAPFTDPLARWHQIRGELVNLSKALVKGPMSIAGWKEPIVNEIRSLASEMLVIEGCDPDCDCKYCHALKRNAWDLNYPNLPDRVFEPDEIWIVDMCSSDDYRVKDAEIFRNEATSDAFILALEASGSGMVANGGPWKITPDKIRTLETALIRLDEIYGIDYLSNSADGSKDLFDAFGEKGCEACGGLIEALPEVKAKWGEDGPSQGLCSCGENQ